MRLSFPLVIAAAVAATVAAIAGRPAAAADVEAGKKAFNKCAACHSIEPGKNRVGPTLFGIFGKKAGQAEGYNYSAAMKNSGLTWDAATLNTYLEKPNDMVKGSKMAFAGIRDATERQNLIAYLETLK